MAINWTVLKDLRDLLGWTQAELAEHIGVHPKTIVNWESSEVPPRSEYKVTRKLADELSYLDGVRAGHLSGVTLDEWKEMRRADLEIAKERYELLSPEDRDREETSYAELDLQRKEATAARQAAFEQQEAARTTLSKFSSIDLLDELTRREYLRTRDKQPANVSGLGEAMDPHEIDLSQGDVDLAASTDNTTVQEQSHPNYENESQDPEA